MRATKTLFLVVAALVGICSGREFLESEPLARAPFSAEAAEMFQDAAADYYGREVEYSVDIGDGVSLELRLIPAGVYMMGSPEDEEGRYKDEGPIHSVRISGPFYIGKYEVTQAQYKAVFSDLAHGERDFEFEGENMPADSVSFEDAERFLNELNRKTGLKFTLPTEAEWEYACRGGTTTAFYFGDSISDMDANYDASDGYKGGPRGAKLERTVEVGAYDPNPFGLYDMCGNVSEWCSDWYRKSFYKESAILNPDGPLDGSEKILRGGSWDDDGKACRSAYRDCAKPSKVLPTAGMRVVLRVGSGRVGLAESDK